MRVCGASVNVCLCMPVHVRLCVSVRLAVRFSPPASLMHMLSSSSSPSLSLSLSPPPSLPFLPPLVIAIISQDCVVWQQFELEETVFVEKGEQYSFFLSPPHRSRRSTAFRLGLAVADLYTEGSNHFAVRAPVSPRLCLCLSTQDFAANSLWRTPG